jgi:hypothetical protein
MTREEESKFKVNDRAYWASGKGDYEDGGFNVAIVDVMEVGFDKIEESFFYTVQTQEEIEDGDLQWIPNLAERELYTQEEIINRVKEL